MSQETVIPEWLAQGNPDEYLQVTFTRGEVVQFLNLLPHLRKVPTLVEVVKNLRDTVLPNIGEQLHALAQANNASQDTSAVDTLSEMVAAQAREMEALRQAVTALSTAEPAKRTRTKKAEVPEQAIVPPELGDSVRTSDAFAIAGGLPQPALVAAPVPTGMPVAAPIPVAAPVAAPVQQPVVQAGVELLDAAGKTPADAVEIDAIEAKIAALGIGAPL